MGLDYVEATYEIDQISSLIKEDKIIFKDNSSIWDKFIERKFIESIILRMPSYPMTFLLRSGGRWEIIDGNKRLIAIKNFILDQTLFLQDLDFLQDLNNKNFTTLSRFIQRRIEQQQVKIFLINENSSKDYLEFFKKTFQR